MRLNEFANLPIEPGLFRDVEEHPQRYHNRAIATQDGIEELINLAKEMHAATTRGEDLGLNDDEIAFYDALAANESAVQPMGNDELKIIAAELVTQVRKSVTIDCPCAKVRGPESR